MLIPRPLPPIRLPERELMRRRILNVGTLPKGEVIFPVCEKTLLAILLADAGQEKGPYEIAMRIAVAVERFVEASYLSASGSGALRQNLPLPLAEALIVDDEAMLATVKEILKNSFPGALDWK